MKSVGAGNNEANALSRTLKINDLKGQAKTTDNEKDSGGIGPGQYNPNVESTKKSAPSYNWAASKTNRAPTNANPRALMSAGIPTKISEENVN